MDLTTFGGFLVGILAIGYGLVSTQSLSAFLNFHGFVLVIGGTLAATLVNTPWALFRDAAKALRFVFFKPRGILAAEAILLVTQLAEKARKSGNLAIENDGQGVGDGFLQISIDACLTTSDEKLAREILGQKLRQIKARHLEITNVYRTMTILFPMFGLVGTLIGIVTVLKNISNPKNVGPAMAVALSTAFFGILMAYMFCVPVSGKLRLRSIEEEASKEIMAEGVLKIFFTGQIPSQIGLYLEAYSRQKTDETVLGAAGQEGQKG